MMRSRTLRYLTEKMETREDVGLKKYGTTVDRTDFNHAKWSVHLEEELMDALMYNRRMRVEQAAFMRAYDTFMRDLKVTLNKEYYNADTLKIQIHQLLQCIESNVTLFRMQETE